VETEHELRTVLDGVGPDLLAFGPDTGHMSWAGMDVPAVLRDYAERIVGVHIKDTFAAGITLARAEDLEALLTRDPALGAPLGEIVANLRLAQSGSERVRDIVRAFKTFSGADRERKDFVDVDAVVDAAVAMVQNEVAHHATLVVQKGGPPRVFGNEAQLGQVFANLLQNAAQSIREGSVAGNEVRIATGRTGDGQVFIDVEDTGSGIPAESLPHIYDAFFTTKPVGAGTGLGLSMVYGIIKQTGGFIYCDSEVGKGTTFHIFLPRYVAGLRPAETSAAADGAGGTAATIDGPAASAKIQPDAPRDLSGSATVLLMDLDRFKEVNDTLGHDVGDQLLEQVGQRLRRLEHEETMVARLGGDEFAVLLGTDDVHVEGMVQRIMRDFRNPFYLGDVDLDVSASIGIAVAPQDGSSAALLLRRAEVAMYDAKRHLAGVAHYASDRDPYSARRLSLISDLSRALDERTLEVHYQPQAEPDSGRVTGVEARRASTLTPTTASVK
jgi:diguanylate cyclase (GGDEF)-like protein